MKRVLWATLPERGHYHPMLGPAAELAKRGVEVTFTAPLDIGDELAAAGFTRFVAPPGRGKPARANRGAEFAALIAQPERLRGWIGAMLVDAAVADIEPLRAIIRELEPDVVALDAMAYAAAIAAHLEGKPWVSVSSSLNPVVPDDIDTPLIRTTRALDPKRRALFASYGIDATFRVADVLSPFATVAFTTEAFAGPAPESVVLAGPTLPVGHRGEPRLPTSDFDIYMSLGTQAFHQPAWFEKAFAAGRRLLAAVGDLTWPRLPETVHVAPYVAQLAALAQARAFISHVGANSLMEAIAFGVPLVMTPICNDQHHNAILAERAGAGRIVDFATATPRAITAALEAAFASKREPVAATGASVAADVIMAQ